MHIFFKILLLFLVPVLAHAQSRRHIDSLIVVLRDAPNDTVRMGIYSMLGGYYDDISVDSGLYYCINGIAIAEKLDLQLNKAAMLAFMAWPLMKTGKYPEALNVIEQGFKITNDRFNAKKAGMLQNGKSLSMYRLDVIGTLYSALESLFFYVGDYKKQLAIAHEAIPHIVASGDIFNLSGIYQDIGDSYLKLNMPDSALYNQKKSLDYFSRLSLRERKFEGATYTSIGMIYEKMGKIDLAKENYLKAIEINILRENLRHTGIACLQLAFLYDSLNIKDSVFLYANKALEAFTSGGYKKEVAISYRLISDYYHYKENIDSSFAYLRLATVLDDSLDHIEKAKLQEFQVTAFNQQLEMQQLEQGQIEKEGNQKTIAIIALIIIFSTIGFLLYRNNRQKQKANQTLHEKNSQIEQALSELKATQKQLIQSEKMASLGELTAGIAHEIQNPLNFVNNFSELNGELIKEIKQELEVGNEHLAKGNTQSAKSSWQQAGEIINDLASNSEKINHHGKRAESIVKGMLEHSRKSTSIKEPTDINKLCDEFVRLSYHGLKAKDAKFNCEYKLDLDPKLPLVNVVSQDIGRVLLNVVNNAFQACNEKLESLKSESQEEYKPLISISTNYVASPRRCVSISISDNGPGIPDAIKDKIFQPFFTTKPTGQGTGLGLSLTYDIVKAHGGELKVETKVASKDDPRLNDTVGQAVGRGEGSQFIIQLPINQN